MLRRGACTAKAGAAPQRALLLAAALLLLPGFGKAKITYTHLLRDDRALIPVAPDYAFGSRGRIDIELRDVAIWQRHEDEKSVNYEKFGFVMLPVVQQEGSQLQKDIMEGKCLLGGRESTLLTFKQPPALHVIQKKAPNATFHIDIENGGWSWVYFHSCEPGAAVSLLARISLYNLRPDGTRDYLSVGETELDTLYWIMFALFAALTLAWTVLLVLRRAIAHRIHWLMGGLLLFKSLTLMAQALMTAHIEANGQPQGWNVAFYFFTTARGLLFFTVVVLIGAGWSYMTPFMNDNTRKALMVVVPAQVFANIALVFVDEESPAMRDWVTWRDLLHMIDLVCCIAILFPIVWQIKHLRDAAQVDGKAARSLAKMRLFRSFYVVVVGYIYFTRIVVYLLKNTVDYRYAWLTEAAAEIGALMFYTWVGVAFRPHNENQYLRLDDADIELATRY